jgi:Xaa-Pro aminopeptidase
MASPRRSQPPPAFARTPLPERFCNLDRLLHAMAARGIDGIVASAPLNVFYLIGFNAIAHKSDEPRPYAVLLSRHAPEHPVLVIADYYVGTFLTRPTWVEDVRPFRAVMMPLDLPPSREDIDRFIPRGGAAVEWIQRARRSYAFDMGTAVRGALKDLKLDRGRVAFDDLAFGFRLGLEGVAVVDGYDPLMFARAVKTEAELEALERATQLNQAAIERTVAAWEDGFTWRDLGRAYARSVTDLGGFVRDPGAMVWGHLPGTDPAMVLATALENDEVKRGAHVMFDCHGTLDLYCWDGGKTWVVGGEPEGAGKRFASATASVAEALLGAMRPGVRVSALQAQAREVYRKAGVPDPAAAVVFFHGLGLSHMDLEQTLADGRPNGDWALEEGMVVPMHLLCPGGERERWWLEEVVVVTKDGGRPLFSWGFAPLSGG